MSVPRCKSCADGAQLNLAQLTSHYSGGCGTGRRTPCYSISRTDLPLSGSLEQIVPALSARAVNQKAPCYRKPFSIVGGAYHTVLSACLGPLHAEGRMHNLNHLTCVEYIFLYKHVLMFTLTRPQPPRTRSPKKETQQVSPDKGLLELHQEERRFKRLWRGVPSAFHVSSPW